MTRVIAEGLQELERWAATLPEKAGRAAALSINQVSKRTALPLSRKKMREEIAFPTGYLEDPKRLSVTKFAKTDDLEAIVTGRGRPTSLARFVSGGRGGLTARVDPNRSSSLSRAFLVRLRAGQGPVTDGAFNLGLAIRLRRDERIENKRFMTPFVAGLYLLYGPSVDQVFRTVSAEVAPEVADALVEEFNRQLGRLSGE